jgi:hypothetical protein
MRSQPNIWQEFDSLTTRSAKPFAQSTKVANNVSLETDAADNWRRSKKRSRERIDGIVATIMAIGIAGEAAVEPTWGVLI